IRFSSVVAAVPVFRGFVGIIFRPKRNPALSQDIDGISYDTPVGLAAGFDKNGEIMPTIAALGFGFGEVGSVTDIPCEGNPKPWFYRLPKTQSAVVNAGLANEGSVAIIKRIQSLNPRSINNFPIILSVAKTNSCEVVSVSAGIKDYVNTIKRAMRANNIKGIELNISCPNAFGGEPFTNPVDLEKLLRAVDKLGVKKPVYVKMPLDLSWREFEGLLDVIVRHKVAGVTIANLQKDRTKVDLRDELPEGIRGYLSGRPTWEASNDLIKRTYKNYHGKLTIIGVGGIFSAQDAYTKIKLGADLVELATGVIFNGPQIVAQINAELVDLLKNDGYTNISQAVGKDA
ncbi:MAG: dihydroorotate dehydrogenase (quinone), partial [Thiobacillus sp.]